MRSAAFKFYGGKDPRELPAYSVPEAAHYLLIPRATLRSWVAGRMYPTKAGRRLFRPVISVPHRNGHTLSFTNLIEAHVLDAIRREHEIPLDKVRRAIEYLRDHFGTVHPLADIRFQTDGLDLFAEKYGQLINITRDGQLAMKRILEVYLRRIERDEAGVAARLYPFTRKREPDEPRSVVIDPRVSFGRPVLAGTGIATAVIAERYKAGESIEELASDYDRNATDIQEAIRCELEIAA